MKEYKICQIGELKEAVPYRAEMDGYKVALVMIQEIHRRGAATIFHNCIYVILGNYFVNFFYIFFR